MLRKHSSAILKRCIFPLSQYRTMSTQNDVKSEIATVGVGCYWGTEHYYRKHFASLHPGSIIDVKVGFMGGHIIQPSYRQVCGGDTDHVEVAQIEYDPTKATYTDIVRFFYMLHDPTTLNRQGNDKGTQYASVIFTHDDNQRKIAEEVTSDLQKRLDDKKITFTRGREYENSKITTAIRPVERFYPAEEDHQLYLTKNPFGYCNHSIRFKWPEDSEL